MSKQLLNTLNSSNDGLFKMYIKTLRAAENLNIAWYPSAGSDFRALLYLTKEYEQQNPIANEIVKTPDLFIYTDYGLGGGINPLENRTLYSDENTTITYTAKEELPALDLPLHDGILNSPQLNTNTGKVFFLLVDIQSSELGSYKVPLLYIFAENEAFAAEVLLPNKAQISHIIHIRYGGGCGGGGKARGSWIPPMLDKFGTNVFVTDNRHEVGSGDKKAVEIYPQLEGDYDTTKLNEVRRIDAEQWSNYGDVSWYEVRK